MNDQAPPMLAEVLEQFIGGRRLPICMPQRPCEAAQWWINMQRPIEADERPRLIPVRGGDGQYWQAPHTDRLKFNLFNFLKLKPQDQQYIIGARDDGVWWNGDSMELFYRVYEESMLQQDMIKASKDGRKLYRNRCFDVMRKCCKGLGFADSAEITAEAAK